MRNQRIESRIEKAKYGPSVNEVVIGAVLSIVLGAFLACAYLVATPVQTVRQVPKASEEHAVYYMEGVRDSGRGKQWLRKKQLFLEGSSIAVNEAELNAWISAETNPPPQPNPTGTLKATPAPQQPMVQVESPNFRVRDGVLQMGCKATLNIDWFRISLPVVAQATGRFEKKAGACDFIPEKCYLGSLPAHRVPGLASMIVDLLVARVPVSDDVKAGWKRVNAAAVEGDSLKLSLP